MFSTVLLFPIGKEIYMFTLILDHFRTTSLIIVFSNFSEKLLFLLLGHMLDTLARTALWEVGLDYSHGTGHGVGAFLNVHEGKLTMC